jgi:hypothetical protein
MSQSYGWNDLNLYHVLNSVAAAQKDLSYRARSWMTGGVRFGTLKRNGRAQRKYLNPVEQPASFEIASSDIPSHCCLDSTTIDP